MLTEVLVDVAKLEVCSVTDEVELVEMIGLEVAEDEESEAEVVEVLEVAVDVEANCMLEVLVTIWIPLFLE